MSSDPIEVVVFQRHEDDLTRLMKGSIDRIKQRLFSKGMLVDPDIEDQYEVLSKMKRMGKVLMFLWKQMKAGSEKESRRIFDKFLGTLDEEEAWGSLKKILSKAVEEQKKTSERGRPWEEVFRDELSTMESLLNTSVVRFPGLLAAHGINLNEATRDQAINPKPDTDVSAKVCALVRNKMKERPKEGFEKFIQCLEYVDSLYFENIIKKLEKDLEEEKTKQLEAGAEKKQVEAAQKQLEAAEEDRCMKDANEMKKRLEKVQQ